MSKGSKKSNIKRITPLFKDRDFDKNKNYRIRYVVAHNNNNVFHSIEIHSDLQVSTGLPYIEVFNSKKEAYARLKNKFIFPSDIVENNNGVEI